MTIALSQLTDLQRVRAALSSIAVDGTVKVERSVNEQLWQTVRGGVALPITSGSAQLDDYEWPDGVTSHYRVTPVDPPAGLLLTGVVGDNASTPDTAALDVSNALDLRIELALDDWDPGENQYLLTKYDFAADQRSYALRLASDGTIEALISSNGTGFATARSGAEPSVDNGGRIALRLALGVDDVSGDWIANFYTSNAIDGSWTKLGDTDTGTTSNPALFDSTAPLVVGAAGDGANPAGSGTVFAAQVRDGGVLVADVRFDQQSDGDTSFDDDAGLTWSINNDAHVVGEVLEQDSITPSLAGRIWLKSIHYPSLNRPVTVTDWSTIARPARRGLFEVKGRNLPIEVSDRRGSRVFDLEVMTDTAAKELVMDGVLALGGPMFIHVPVDCPVPGGYVSIGDVGDERRTRSARSPRRYWPLPCTIKAPPGPDVVGTTVTWGTIFDRYGDWNAVYAAHPAYRGTDGLLALVGSPEDLFAP